MAPLNSSQPTHRSPAPSESLTGTPWASCWILGEVMHHRFQPKEHRFAYAMSALWLNLDDGETLHHAVKGFGWNRWNIYSIAEGDHFPATHDPGLQAKTTLKARLQYWLERQNVDWDGTRAELIAQPRFLGYTFNPLSVYFCFDANNQPVCAVAEVENTFLEVKPFVVPLLDSSTVEVEGDEGSRTDTVYTFEALLHKHFYVSPFADVRQQFRFHFTYRECNGVATAAPALTVESIEEGSPMLVATFAGKAQPFTSRGLWSMTWRTFAMPQRIIALIHLHAVILFFKGLRVHLKESQGQWQRGVLNPHRSIASYYVSPPQPHDVHPEARI